MTKKILVIDDEDLVGRSLLLLLKKSGYDPVVVSSGAEALTSIKTNDFDLIVSDIRMPDMDGIAVIKKIREILKKENKTAIPEILITGYASEEHMNEAEELNVADYIHKPFDVKDFIEIVKKVLKES